jgi:phage-related protein
MAKAATAFVDFEGDFDGLKGGLDGQARAVEGSFNDAFGRVAKFAAGVLATVGVGKFLADSFGEAEDAAKVAEQTQAVITSTGAAAGVTAGQVDSLATALSNKSAVDDEVIASGENVLLTFTNIQNKAGEGNNVFDQATEAALNMSAAMGTDLQGSIVQVGKALNDPIKGMTALSKVGVSFTQEQKDQVAAMVAAGDQMGAQKLILAELSKEFGGAAEAAATPTERLKTTIGNLEETLGGALLPVAAKFGDILSKLAPKLEPLLGAVGELAGTLGGALADALAAVLPAIEPLLPVLTSVAQTLAQGLGGALQAVLPALGSLVAALAPLLPPIAELANVLLGALAGVLVQLATALTPVVQQLVTGLQPVFAELQPVIPQMAEALVEVLQALLPLIPTLADLLQMILPILVVSIKWNALITSLIADAITPLIAILTIVVNSVLVALMAAIQVVIGVFTDFQGSLDRLKQFFATAWDAIKVAVQVALDAVVGFMASLPGRAVAAAAALPGLLLDLGSRGVAAIASGGEAAFGGVVSFLAGLPGRMVSAIGDIVGTFTPIGADIIHGIQTGAEVLLGGLIHFIASIPGEVVSALGDMGHVLYDAGTRLIGGFLAGIKDAVFGGVKSFLGGVGDLVTGWKGPPAYDAKILIGNGELIMRGLVTGMRNGMGEVRDFLSTVAPEIGATTLAPGLLAGADASAAGAGDHFHLDFTAVSEPMTPEGLATMFRRMELLAA